MLRHRRASNLLFAPRRRTGELQCSSTRSHLRHEMDVCGQQKAPTALSSGKELQEIIE